MAKRFIQTFYSSAGVGVAKRVIQAVFSSAGRHPLSLRFNSWGGGVGGGGGDCSAVSLFTTGKIYHDLTQA